MAYTLSDCVRVSFPLCDTKRWVIIEAILESHPEQRDMLQQALDTYNADPEHPFEQFVTYLWWHIDDALHDRLLNVVSTDNDLALFWMLVFPHISTRKLAALVKASDSARPLLAEEFSSIETEDVNYILAARHVYSRLPATLLEIAEQTTRNL